MENGYRLIDANALADKFEGSFARSIGESRAAYRAALEETLDAPTVEAVEVVHARWVDKMVRDWHCSVCGKKVPRQVYFDGYCYDDKLIYCPNCGAKMDGGNEDA